MEQKVQTSHMAPPNPLPGYTKTVLLTSFISAVSLVTISEPILIKYYQLKSIVYIKVNINCVIHSMALENITCINHYKHHTKQFHSPKNPLCSTHSSFPHSNPYNPQQPLIDLVCMCGLFVCLFSFGCTVRFAGSQFPNQGSNPGPWLVKVPSPNHWPAREFPGC